MIPYDRLVKRAFVPAQPDQQQPGPDGMPAGPGAGAPPAGDPSAAAGAPPAGAPPAGGAPMDPAAAAGAPPAGAGAPPADPSQAGAGAPPAGGQPTDPTAGPADPAAAGSTEPPANPIDPVAAAAQAAPTELGPDGQPIDKDKPILDPNAQVGHGQADLVMHVVERALDAFDKSKKNKAAPKPAGAGGDAGAADPASQPGPVTGMPGDMSSIAGSGPLGKTGSVGDILGDLFGK